MRTEEQKYTLKHSEAKPLTNIRTNIYSTQIELNGKALVHLEFPHKISFDKLLLEAFDEGLSILGSSAKQIIYLHLREIFGIEKAEIPCKIGDFCVAIEKIFGMGAKILEIVIMKKLYEKIRKTGNFTYYLDEKSLTFPKYIQALRKYYENHLQERP